MNSYNDWWLHNANVYHVNKTVVGFCYLINLFLYLKYYTVFKNIHQFSNTVWDFSTSHATGSRKTLITYIVYLICITQPKNKYRKEKTQWRYISILVKQTFIIKFYYWHRNHFIVWELWTERLSCSNTL